MKRGAAGIWFIVVSLVFCSVSGLTIKGFVGDTMTEGEHSIMDVVGNVNQTLSETQKAYTNLAISSTKISGDLRKYLDDLNKTLSHVRDREYSGGYRYDDNTPCMYRLPNPSGLTEELLTIKLIESEKSSTYDSGVRVQTLIGQQVKDTFNIPGLVLCSVGGTDSHGDEYAENFHNWYWEQLDLGEDMSYQDWKGWTHNDETNQWTYILNSGSDKDEDYMVVDGILDGEEPYKLEVGALGDFWDTGSGDWIYSPKKGYVCIIPAYDSPTSTESYDHCGFHPDAIDEMFEDDFGSYVGTGDFPRHTVKGYTSGKTPGEVCVAGRCAVGNEDYSIIPTCNG